MTEKVSRAMSGGAQRRLNLLDYLLRSSAFPALTHRLERAALDVDARLARLSGGWSDLSRSERDRIGAGESSLARAAERMSSRGRARIASVLGRLSAHDPRFRVAAAREGIDHIGRTLRVRIAAVTAVKERDLDVRVRTLAGLHPLGVLRRGYTYCTVPDGREVIQRSAAVAPGDRMEVHFYDGGALCRVERKRKGTACRKRLTSKHRSSDSR
jgi:exonuclease VII large subunit